MAEAKAQPKAVAKSGRKAVILVSGQQYLVEEGQELDVALLPEAKTAEFPVLMLIDGEKTNIGSPMLAESKVSADILEPQVKAEKVVAIRYKAKKRVHKRRGHRQLQTRIKVTKIV